MPLDILNAARQMVPDGKFDLDPASSFTAKNIHETPVANIIYDEESNGLRQEWFGNVWLFPPFIKDGVKKFQYKWLEKAEQKWKMGDIESCLVLLQVSFGDGGFLRAIQYPHVFLTKPLHFLTPSGKEKYDMDSNYMMIYL